jgi:hypothetical protein
MGTQQGLFFQALIERFPHPGLGDVLKTAPEPIASLLGTLPNKAEITPDKVWTAPRGRLLSIHPSWCDNVIVQCPAILQPTLQTVLRNARENHSEGLRPLPLFLLDYIVSKWPEKGVQGVESIGETPLRWLADCNEQKLNDIANLLVVHDVVDIVRHIVEKKILQKILRPFSPLQQRYLRTLLRRPIRSATLNTELLSLLQDSPEEAKECLKRRGLEKLGQSLQGTPPLLVWHVLHHVDQKLAQLLSKIIKRSVPEAERLRTRREALHAYEFLKRAETT